jgi:hypothetical protein
LHGSLRSRALFARSCTPAAANGTPARAQQLIDAKLTTTTKQTHQHNAQKRAA